MKVKDLKKIVDDAWVCIVSNGGLSDPINDNDKFDDCEVISLTCGTDEKEKESWIYLEVANG